MLTFSERVIKITLEIPKGKVTTYGAIAREAGAGPMAAQSITSMLGKAYQAGDKQLKQRIPFHRLVDADGRSWVRPSSRKERRAFYNKEGIKLGETDRLVHLTALLVEFK